MKQPTIYKTGIVKDHYQQIKAAIARGDSASMVGTFTTRLSSKDITSLQEGNLFVTESSTSYSIFLKNKDIKNESLSNTNYLIIGQLYA